MSAVDVLAVIKSDALCAEEWRFMQAGDKFARGAAKASNEAHAAISELIAALTDERNTKSWRSDEIGARIIRTDAALARCKGGAA